MAKLHPPGHGQIRSRWIVVVRGLICGSDLWVRNYGDKLMGARPRNGPGHAPFNKRAKGGYGDAMLFAIFLAMGIHEDIGVHGDHGSRGG